MKNPDGTITYHLVCATITPGEPGSGGGAEEDCGQDQANLPYEGAPFCYGGIPCQYTDNIVPLAPPATPAPEGQKWQARYCTNGTKVLVLTGGNQPRPLIVQAQEAFGNLAPPAGGGQAQPGRARDRAAADLAVAGPRVVRGADRQLGRGADRGGRAGHDQLGHR